VLFIAPKPENTWLHGILNQPGKEKHMENISVREWIEKFNNGEFEDADIDTQIEAGWYDWFCKRDELPKRLKKMGNIIKDIKNDFILDNFRVWFKNNCPLEHPLYDDFRFEPIIKDSKKDDEDKREQLYFGISCDFPYDHKYKYEIFTARNDYSVEFTCNDKDEVLHVINQLADDFQK
jgi:hypothetical protein